MKLESCCDSCCPEVACPIMLASWCDRGGPGGGPMKLESCWGVRGMTLFGMLFGIGGPPLAVISAAPFPVTVMEFWGLLNTGTSVCPVFINMRGVLLLGDPP